MRWITESSTPKRFRFDAKPLRTFKELQEKRTNQSVEAAERRREERSQFLHAELMHRLRTAVTHERTGDLGIAKMLEVGFKSTGEIGAKSASASICASLSRVVFAVSWFAAPAPSAKVAHASRVPTFH